MTTKPVVLLVDDEPMIRALGSMLLSKAGYEVLLAEDGQAGVELFGTQPERIDLVILDLQMPRLSGREALRQLQQLKPTLRVLISSGFCAEVGQAGDAHGVCGFVHKPYRSREFTDAVAAALAVALPENPQDRPTAPSDHSSSP
jgi:CheY-like chemotaxis protein